MKLNAAVRIAFAMATGASLSGCVTTQGGVGALNNPLMALSDVFDKTGNEFRALLREKKFSEAREFFDANSDYFSKRLVDSKERVQDEVRPLLDYVYNTEYERQLPSSLARMSVISDVSDASRWQQQEQALQEAFKLTRAARQDKVLSFFDDYPGKAQAAALTGQLERVVSLAKAQREPALESTFPRILAQGVPAGGITFIGYLFTAESYLRNAKFQEALVQRLEQVPESGLADEIQRFADLMTPDTQKRVMTDIFGGRLKKQMLADGRIDLDELHRLMQAKRAFPRLDLSEFVKVGVMDLTSGTLKSRGTFDFEIEFTQDLPIQAEAAKDAVLNSASAAGYDFLFVTDLSLAKVNREFKNKKDMDSRVQTGIRQQQNPAYVGALTQYQKAMAEYQSAALQGAVNSSRPCYGNALACALAGAANAFPEAMAKGKVEKSQQLLANTSQFVEVPVYSAYRYQAVDVDAAKSARVDYFIIDVKAKKTYSNFFEVNNREKFTVVYNVQDADPSKGSILANNQKEDDVIAWEKRPVTVRLSQLFDAQNAKTANVTPFTGMQAFLKPLTNRAYVSAAPSYTGQATSAAERPKAGSSTIADDRFDSVVVVRASKGIGAGFYVTPDLVLTAYHVVDGTNLVELSTYDGGKNYGKVVDHDVRLDLALVRAQSPGKPVKIHTGPIKLGETVEAIGHPKGYEYTITRGVISAVRKTKGANINTHALVEFIQTDTPISPGNSGGPLFMNGVVIGVNDWVRVDKASQNLNFSVSYNEIKEYLDRFKGK